MMPRDIYLKRPQYISDVVDGDTSGLWLVVWGQYSTWLGSLGMDTDTAQELFLIDYNCALTQYKMETIITLIRQNAYTHRKKYDKLIAVYQLEYNPIENYNRVETSTNTRTPDLTRETDTTTTTTAEQTSDGTAQINQTRETAVTPANVQTVSARDVAPYDSTTMQPQSRDTVTQTGTTTTTDTYSGNPDTTHGESQTQSTGSGSTTETETGTDTTEIESQISGNIGVTTSQQMIESEMQLAAKMNIWKIIEKDIAAAILLQCW